MHFYSIISSYGKQDPILLQHKQLREKINKVKKYIILKKILNDKLPEDIINIIILY
jgi:hypothetical protein